MGILFPKKCVLCCKTLPLDAGKAMLCPDCARHARQKYRCTEGIHLDGTDGAAAALYYTGDVAGAMKRFKFNHRQHYADWFAAQTLPLLAERLEKWKPDLVTFIPIGLMRLYQRGYNQAELLAEQLAAPLGLPCRATLSKRAFVGRQSRREGLAARQRNAAKAFQPMTDVDLTGQNVVLVDDIITTGATVEAAAGLLRQMGAAHVYALAPTRARQKRQR